VEDYSLEALGQVVKRLRREKGLTQEELGDAADYKGGAGVSISRLEHGRLQPTPERFAGIAQALGISQEELELRASEEAASHQGEAGDRTRTYEERVAAIVQASERRRHLAPELEAFAETSKRAEHAFLTRFRDVAVRVNHVPPHDDAQLAHGGGAETNGAEAEAAYQIQFTQYGVSRALAERAGGAGVGGVVRGATAHLAFTQAVALGAAPLGATVPSLAGAAAALNGLRAAMGVGRPANRVGGTAGGMNLLATVAVGTVVAAILERQAAAKRSRKQHESAAKLAAAEADIDANQANVEALLDVIPRATEILDYVAIHAGHALTRWGTQIGDDIVPWETLGETEQQRYHDFVAIAAAQLAVATIDLPELATSRDTDLEQATAVADQILIQAKRAITSRV